MGLTTFEGAQAGGGAAAAAAAGGVSLGARSRNVASLARAGAYVSLAGMLLGFVGVLLPHPAQFNVPALVASECTTAVFAFVFLAFADRVPMWAVRLAPPLGTLQATAAVIFSGDPTSAYVLFYLWPCFYAFYFLSRLDGALNVALVIAGYGLAIAVTNPPPGDVSAGAANLTHHFVLLAGTLAIAGVMMHVLRTRVDRLWGRLVAAARTDLTTGLLNGTGGHEILATEIDRARMSAQRVALLSVNVVGLREIRGRYGHDAGDDLIREVGRLLDESTRRIDTVARSGDAEFTLVLPETDEHTAYLLAEQILARLRRTYRERSLPLRASVGVAAFPKHAAEAEALQHAAAAAAAVAGTLGSDRAVVYTLDLESVGSSEGSRTMGERRAHLSTVLSLAEVLDMRDQRFASHSVRGQPVLRDDRAGARPARGADRAPADGRHRPRHRQGGAVGLDPGQAGAAVTGGMGRGPQAPRAGRPDPRCARAHRHPGLDPRSARAARRPRLPAGHLGRRDPAGVAHPRGRRVLRRDHERASLQDGEAPDGGDRRARALQRKPVRRGRRRRSGPRARPERLERPARLIGGGLSARARRVRGARRRPAPPPARPRT